MERGLHAVGDGEPAVLDDHRALGDRRDGFGGLRAVEHHEIRTRAFAESVLGKPQRSPTPARGSSPRSLRSTTSHAWWT